MRRNVKDLIPYVRRIALDTGVLRGHRNYSKFIILARSRTGSEYLRSLLGSHSQAYAFGELFQKPDELNWNFPDFYRSRSERLLLQSRPVLFLEQEIFRTYPKQIAAVGFKIFYYDAQDVNSRIVWTYLQSQRDLKVIHDAAIHNRPVQLCRASRACPRCRGCAS